MKKKIVGIYVCMLLITTILPITGTVIAGDEENPEIEDEAGDRFFSCLDVISAWFTDDGENLYVSIKVANPKNRPFLGYTVIWSHNGTKYFASMQGDNYYFGDDKGDYPLWRYMNAEGICDKETGVITITVPLYEIGDPQQGEELTRFILMSHFTRINHYFPVDYAYNENKYVIQN